MPKVARRTAAGAAAVSPKADGTHSATESPAMRAVGPVAASDLVPIELVLEPEHPVRTTMDDQAMEDLIDSMREIGLIQPVILVRKGTHFETVVGHRRLYAARALKWAKIPAVIFSNKGLALEAARIHENAIREDVNAGDEAIYLRELVDRYGLDEAGLCALLKRSPQWIAARWSLLLGDEQVLQAVREGKIRLSVAQELNKITDEGYRRMYLSHAIRSGYSAAAVAGWRRDWEAQGAPGVTPAAPSPTTEIEAAAAAGVARTECFLCGGYLDPWAMDIVYIHRREREEIMRQMAIAAQPPPEAEPPK